MFMPTRGVACALCHKAGVLHLLSVAGKLANCCGLLAAVELLMEWGVQAELLLGAADRQVPVCVGCLYV